MDQTSRGVELETTWAATDNFRLHAADGDWTVGTYGRNITDVRHDNARLNTGDYVLVMQSNDASEFGVRFIKEF